MQSSYYLNTSRVTGVSSRVTTVEKVSRQEFPSGHGDDSGGGNTVKLIESTVARFGPIASFRGTYRSRSWALTVTQRNQTQLTGKFVSALFVLILYMTNLYVCSFRAIAPRKRTVRP